MMKILALLACVVAMASAAPHWAPFSGFPYYHGYHYWNIPYYAGYPYHAVAGYPYGTRLIYYGEYRGSCAGAPDGLYYVDEKSFAYCSNGQKTIQPCADGSANAPLDHFKSGGYYGFYDFCAINLVAQGYNAQPKVDGYPETKVETGYNTESYGDKDDSQYVKEDTYVVEEAHGDGYQDNDKGHYGDEKSYQPYEPSKNEVYEGEYYEKKTYVEPPKAGY